MPQLNSEIRMITNRFKPTRLHNSVARNGTFPVHPSTHWVLPTHKISVGSATTGFKVPHFSVTIEITGR